MNVILFAALAPHSPQLGGAVLAACLAIACAFGIAGIFYFVLGRANADRKLTAVLSSLACAAALTTAMLGAYAAKQGVSLFWIQQLLTEHAADVYVLQRARSVSCKTATPDELAWLDTQIRDKEQMLSSPEYQNVVSGDETIHNFRSRTEELRNKSHRPKPPDKNRP